VSPVAYCGGRVLVDGGLVSADVTIDDGLIVAVDETEPPPDRSTTARSSPDTVDCTGQIISAGFIDLQCNGADGVDLTREPEGIAHVARQLPRFGVTAFLPTVVTAPASNRARAVVAVQQLAASRDASSGAVALGLHFEGPMISVDHLGAHTESHVAAVSPTEIDEWVGSGAVSMVTLAPEIPGGLAAIEQLAAAGVVVSGGHTAMTPDEFITARVAGLGYITHLFNAMAPFSHRAPGPIGAVLADDGVVAGLICDGIHVDPTAVRLAWRLLGPERMSLVSDASAALGAPFGTFRLGGVDVVHDATGVRTADGVLAGSDLALDRAVRNLMAFTGCDLADALATVTSTPADLLGLTDRGRIRVGARADLTVLTATGELVATIVDGAIAWKS